MSRVYTCPNECGTAVAVVNSETAPSLLCAKCNRELRFARQVSTQWVGHEYPNDNYRITGGELQ